MKPCVAPSESARLGAKQGRAKSAKRDCFSASSFLKFRISHFAFPNKILPFRPASAPRTRVGALRAKARVSVSRNCGARPGNAGREPSVPQSPITNLSFRPWRPWREQSAFSLTEVVIAMGVAAVAFTSIIALFPLGLNMSKESYEATQAALIAQTILADVKDQQTGNGNQRVSSAPWNTKLIQIANNSDPINVLTNYVTVQIDTTNPQIVYIAYKPFVGTGNDTDTSNPYMLRPSTGINTTNTPNWYSAGSNGATMLVKVTFSPTIRIGSATSTSSPQRVDVSVETPGSASITNRTCYLFTGAVRP